jgi:L-lactate dehydrogenase complex protein LldG
VSEREAIVSRIREALTVTAPRPGSHGRREPAGIRSAAAEARQWLPPAGDSPPEWLALFAQNCAELRTRFHLVHDAATAHAKIAEIAVTEGWKRIATHDCTLAPAAAAAPGLPVLTIRDGYSVNDLEACDAGVTECDALIAQTGTVLLTARSGGGRALSILPPHHVVVARQEQLVPDLPAAYTLLHQKYGPADWPSMITFITGPSRTGDIERILILGAHGPKKLTVILF